MRILLLALSCVTAAARADVPASCPAALRCTQLKARLATCRRELAARKATLERKSEPRPDEVTLEKTIADLKGLSRCTQCAGRLRSEAHMLEAGTEGLLANYYDSWGMKKGEDGRRSFRAMQEATRSDPQNLSAWTSYGKSLVAVDGRVTRGRIASYMGINLPSEIRRAADNLRRLLPAAPPSSDEAKAVLASLDQIGK